MVVVDSVAALPPQGTLPQSFFEGRGAALGCALQESLATASTTAGGCAPLPPLSTRKTFRKLSWDCSPVWQGQPLDPQDVPRVVDAIRYCLDNPEETKAKLETCLRHRGCLESGGGVSYDCARETLQQLLTGLGLPVNAFGRLDVVLHRFDVDGNGFLDEEEIQQIFSTGLAHRWRELTGKPIGDVPVREVDAFEDAGYFVEKELGRGGQAVMYLARGSYSAAPYCLKVYAKEDAEVDDASGEDLKEEFAIMQMLHHENIAKTYEVFQDHSYYYLVNQPYFGGNLSEIGHRATLSNVNMTEGWWRRIFAQCLDGLSFLHRNAIMHCDLKELNVMVADMDNFHEPRVVLIDFGLAVSFGTGCSGVKGTPGYIPPETWRKGIWYPQGDIFSLGVMFFQLLTGYVSTGSEQRGTGLFTENAQTIEDVIRFTQERQPDWQRFPEWPRARDFVASLLQKGRAERPVAMQARQHAWFSDTSDAKLPRDIVCRLSGRSAEAVARGRLLEKLRESSSSSLHVLRALRDKLAAKLATSGTRVPVDRFIDIMVQAGVDKADAVEYARIAQHPNGVGVPCTDILSDAIFAKAKHDHKGLRFFSAEVLPRRRGTCAGKRTERSMTCRLRARLGKSCGPSTCAGASKF